GRRRRRARHPRVDEDGDPGCRADRWDGERGRRRGGDADPGRGSRRRDRRMIHFDQRGAVALVTIDRPERRNAVDHEALEQLAVPMERAVEPAPATRAVVLTGARGHFCAGADLTGLEDAGFATVLRGVLDRLRDAPLPVIAAVDGAALGAGTQLAI